MILAILLAVINSTNVGPTSYACDGLTSQYTVNFPYTTKSDLLVTSTTSAGAITTLSLNTNYTLSVTSTSTTALLTLTAPATSCPNTNVLKIALNMPLTQPLTLSTQSQFLPQTIMQMIDRTTLQLQQVNTKISIPFSSQGASLGSLGSGIFGVNCAGSMTCSVNNGIVQLSAPTTTADASNVTATGSNTARPLPTWMSDRVNIVAFGATTVAVDNQVAIQAAVTYACANLKSVYIPAGTYKVASTITACGNIKIFGDGNLSVLQPTIADGTPVLNFPPGSSFFKVSDIAIISTINTANFDAGTAQAQQCTAIRVQSTLPNGPFSSRFSLDNVHVVGVKIAYDIVGHILTANNLWAQYNEVGFQCTADCNSYDLNLRLEDNRQDFNITSAAGIMFRQLIMEGANSLGVASTLDSARGITMFSPYFEQAATAPRTQPWILVGGVGLVSDFKLLGGEITSSGGFATGVYPLKFDFCVNCEVNGHFEEGSQLRKVLTTANTVDFKLTGDAAQNTFLTDESKQISRADNYWPNGSFEMWLRGFTIIQPTRATFSKETTIVRRGSNALRVTATAGTNFNYVLFNLTGQMVTALRGRVLRAGAWVWVPNIAEYNETARTAFPTIILDSYNGVTEVQSNSNTLGTARNAWNYVTVAFTVQADATRIGIGFMANDSGTNADGTEFIVVDDVTLVDGSVPVSRQMMGDVSDSVLLPAIGVNGQMISNASAIPTDVNQVYGVGDVVWNSGVVAGGTPGWLCTTGGSPGTWKAMANVAP